ncbi:hypothetical protein VKT23_009993 [Stygiomarasmius scandens]|uniref:DUF6532 domain-containing protein n=1 Tax=Marasmiellus scandens TaxID=2682957 RepID=A0ABR1JF76_9AGAR
MDTESDGAVDTEYTDGNINSDAAGHVIEPQDSGELANETLGPIIIDSSDDDSDYQDEDIIQPVKSNRNKKAKVSKTALRDSITAARTIKPQASVNPMPNVNAAKRKASTAAEHVPKRPKASVIGGLDKNWKASYGKKNTSSTSLASSLADSSDGLAVLGEFDKDEPRAATDAGRVDKDRPKFEASDRILSANNTEKVYQQENATQIVLVPANVADIDRKERGKRSQARVVVSSKHLPFVNLNDKDIWKNSYLPEIYNWLGSIRDQFSATSPSHFQAISRDAFLRCYPGLPAKYTDEDGMIKNRVDHPAIAAVTKAAIVTYRSDLAKQAFKFVKVKMDLEVPEQTVEGRKAWVAAQLNDMAILYETPGTSKKDHKGLFKSTVVSQTLAWHLYKVKDSPKHRWFGFPAGALALSITAIKRALYIWSDGIEKREDDGDNDTDTDAHAKKAGKKQAPRNSPTSFSQGQWSSTVEFYFDKYTSKLSDDKFNEIMAYAEEYLPERSKKLFQSTEGEEDELVMSD